MKRRWGLNRRNRAGSGEGICGFRERAVFTAEAQRRRGGEHNSKSRAVNTKRRALFNMSAAMNSAGLALINMKPPLINGRRAVNTKWRALFNMSAAVNSAALALINMEPPLINGRRAVNTKCPAVNSKWRALFTGARLLQ